MTELSKPSSISTTRPWIFVLQTGVIATALALGGVWYIGKHWPNVNPMGYFFYSIIPIGAIGVGLIPAIGYTWGSWWTGLRVARSLLVAIVCLQLLAYLAAHYLEFRAADLVYTNGERVSFWHYFHISTMTLSFLRDDGQPGRALGYLGYGVRFLEAAGFAASAAVLPRVLSSTPYCPDCQRYKKTRELGSTAAIPIPGDDEEREQQDPAPPAPAPGALDVQQLSEHVHRGNAAYLEEIVASLVSASKAKTQFSTTANLSLVYCPGCLRGDLRASVVEHIGDSVRIELAPRMPIGPELFHACERK